MPNDLLVPVPSGERGSLPQRGEWHRRVGRDGRVRPGRELPGACDRLLSQRRQNTA